MEKIDFVVLWVNGEDPLWLKKRKKYDKHYDENDVRYRDYESLLYLFRSIEKYSPWVNSIYLITDNQTPEWINASHPKLKIVNHTEFIPEEYLPTFNSNVIELNLFRISDLSERFILFNDDMFLNDYIYPEDFFLNDKILDFGIYNKIAPVENFAHILVNDLILINKHFSKKESLKKNWKKQFSLKYGTKILRNFFLLPWPDIPGYYNPHTPQPHFKSLFSKLYSLEPEFFERTFRNKFRGYDDINHWICRYWLLETGKYEAQNLSFCSYINLSETKKIEKELTNGKSKVCCINDVKSSQKQFMTWKSSLLDIFKKKFPQKSTFEK